MELNVHEIYIYTIYKQTCERLYVHMINMVYMCIAVAALPWYNICIVLQIDQCRYFIIVFNNIHML